MKIFLTRHGETEENKAGILQGHLPGKLSSLGIEQANKVASRLQDVPLDYIYSSDLARASDTAKAIARYHSKTPLIFTEELRERNIGELQGKKKSDFGWSPEEQKIMLMAPKNGETIADVYQRAKEFLVALLEQHQTHETILLVCHGGVGKALVAVLTGKVFSDILTMESLQNTSISIFDISPEHVCTTLMYNNTDHLANTF